MSHPSKALHPLPLLGVAAAVALLAAGLWSEVQAQRQDIVIDDGGGGGGGGGGGTPPPACSTPSIGCWKRLPFPAVSSVNMAALKTGKVLITERSFSDVFQRYQIFDPATDSFGPVQTATVPHNLYCAGFDQLPDGRILFAGSVNTNDDNKATIYDPAANTWAAQPNMSGGRFYPTVITMSPTELLALDGDDFAGQSNPNIPEAFNAQFNVWRGLFGAEYGVSQPPPHDFELPVYPRAHVISTGSVIYTGSREYFNQQGANSTRILDPLFQTWSAPLGVDPIVGRSGVMYERDLIMKAGPALVYKLAATTPGAVWTPLASLNIARSNFFVPALPDGKVLAVGEVTTPEMYDPAANTWTNMALAPEARGDHSGTVLLADGRVLTAGPTFTADVYSPPYLFTPTGGLASRPVITSVSGGGGANVIRYGEVFKVASPSAVKIDEIRLIRLGMATHSWDMGQRSQRLAFQRACCDPALEPGADLNPTCIEGHTCCLDGQWTCNGAGATTVCSAVCNTLAVFAPQDAYQAPTVYYYLFVVVDGVPSKAAIVKVG